MKNKEPWFEVVALPALLRHARVTYGLAMHRALAEAGYDDMPKNGMYIIGGMALETGEIPLGELIKQLRVSKQAGGQLVDTLVVRGYLKREEDPEDRRKSNITLTKHGRAAAAVQNVARKKIDAQLIERVGSEDVLRTRRTLAALIDMGHETEPGEVQEQ
ncbi:MAG TPA: MarR family transcriptional regulator [Verrucomicrobiae bacterium]|jgi:DNA-binding MarR family transcriptional regulator|nr:MarR family transcriptional regulator [Verrucomicrobiae bacterium]